MSRFENRTARVSSKHSWKFGARTGARENEIRIWPIRVWPADVRIPFKRVTGSRRSFKITTSTRDRAKRRAYVVVSF